MKALYLDCSSGISGDMAVAALIDAGADRAVLAQALDSIPAQGFRTEITAVQKNGVAACDFNVILDEENHDHDMHYLFGETGEGVHAEHGHHHEHEHHHDEPHHHHVHRGLPEIFPIIDATRMTDGAKQLAKRIFDILADAESKAHNVPKDEVHFHEVGALDSIVDVIALAVCFDNLGVEKVYATPLKEGTGTIRCAHGILGIPVPAVANILEAHHIPLAIKDEHGEFVTPTGAAFIAAIAPEFSVPAPGTILKSGMGAGKRAYKVPSVLRALVLEELQETERDTITKLECNIDDCTGENLGFVQETLFAAGARDVTVIPCYMKKNRPAFLLQVICDTERVPEFESLIFEHTTTIGIRRVKMERTKLIRRPVEIETPFGTVQGKEVSVNGKLHVYPEYESVKRLCMEKNLGFVEVMAAASASGIAASGSRNG